jgi:hypothetical protein
MALTASLLFVSGCTVQAAADQKNLAFVRHSYSHRVHSCHSPAVLLASASSSPPPLDPELDMLLEELEEMGGDPAFLEGFQEEYVDPPPSPVSDSSDNDDDKTTSEAASEPFVWDGVEDEDAYFDSYE